MGPRDPFADPTVRPHPLDGPRPTPDAPRSAGGGPTPMSRPRSASLAPLMGVLVGLVFGVLLITVGFGAALVVVLCAGLGAGIGSIVNGALSDRFDLGAAWRALRNRS